MEILAPSGGVPSSPERFPGGSSSSAAPPKVHPPSSESRDLCTALVLFGVQHSCLVSCPSLPSRRLSLQSPREGGLSVIPFVMARRCLAHSQAQYVLLLLPVQLERSSLVGRKWGDPAAKGELRINVRGSRVTGGPDPRLARPTWGRGERCVWVAGSVGGRRQLTLRTPPGAGPRVPPPRPLAPAPPPLRPPPRPSFPRWLARQHAGAQRGVRRGTCWPRRGGWQLCSAAASTPGRAAPPAQTGVPWGEQQGASALPGLPRTPSAPEGTWKEPWRSTPSPPQGWGRHPAARTARRRLQAVLVSHPRS